MIAANHSPSTLAARFWAETPGNAYPRSAVLILTGTFLLALSAHIQVPFWPVKMSMQTFVVLTLGAAFGSRLGALTVIAYCAQGAMGLPVFQNGGGLVHFVGPTAGYLLGFIGAAWIAGFFAERGAMRSLSSAFGVFLLSDAVIMIAGTGWLSVLIGWEKAVSAGFVIFLPAEMLKIALAAVLMHATRPAAATR